MNIIKTFSPLLKEPELKDGLPTVIRVNKFTEASAKSFTENMSKAQNTGQTVIPVVIDSYGGSVYALMTMISAIKHSKIPVATIVEGKAMSCGAILFSFGAQGKRFMDPDATVMIHDVSSMSFGKAEEIKASAEETERLNQKIYHMMAANCGQDTDYFLDIVHERGHADWFLDAKESKKHGLANHIRVPSFKISTTVKFEFK
jgi:ATP-dependent Clp protease protease subunit